MNPQKLHDALTELDEELVLAAEKRRNTGPRQKRWQHLGALAACLCILTATGLTVARLNGLSIDRKPTEVTVTPTQAVIPTQSPGADSTDKPTGGVAAELPAVRVRITDWGEGGFTGTVTGVVDTETLPVGASVKVLLERPVSVELPGKNRILCYRGLPKSSDFPTGTEVLLRFCYQVAEADGTVTLRIEAISPA